MCKYKEGASEGPWINPYKDRLAENKEMINYYAQISNLVNRLNDLAECVIESKHIEETECTGKNFYTENDVSTCDECGKLVACVRFCDLDPQAQMYWVYQLEDFQVSRYTIKGRII